MILNFITIVTLEEVFLCNSITWYNLKNTNLHYISTFILNIFPHQRVCIYYSFRDTNSTHKIPQYLQVQYYFLYCDNFYCVLNICTCFLQSSHLCIFLAHFFKYLEIFIIFNQFRNCLTIFVELSQLCLLNTREATNWFPPFFKPCSIARGLPLVTEPEMKYQGTTDQTTMVPQSLHVWVIPTMESIIVLILTTYVLKTTLNFIENELFDFVVFQTNKKNGWF